MKKIELRTEGVLFLELSREVFEVSFELETFWTSYCLCVCVCVCVCDYGDAEESGEWEFVARIACIEINRWDYSNSKKKEKINKPSAWT